jgi:tetratricopeptide (TPR) repeat protein
VWSALAVPGIPVRDLASASAALCCIAEDMERGGALNLAYATVTNMRIAMLERGPAGARGAAAWQQARVLRQMGMLEEAQDTYECAQEDAVRAGDKDLEARALLGQAVVAGQRGNYPAVRDAAQRALALVPADSVTAADAHNDLMIAAMAGRDFATALEHGWRGYDAATTDVDRRAGMVTNLASLAFRMGRYGAARKGYLASLNLSSAERICLPTLSGLALVDAASNDLDELRRVAAAIARKSTTSTLPFEVAVVHFELAQAWQQLGESEKSDECITRARDLAVAHGFHEVAYRSELLGEAIAAHATAAKTRRDARVESGVARFDELPVDEAALVAV